MFSDVMECEERENIKENKIKQKKRKNRKEKKIR
jgi:hypothetical protein